MMTTGFFLAAALLLQTDTIVQVQTTDGAPLRGVLRSLDDARIVLEVDSDEREIPLEAVLQVTFPRDSALTEFDTTLRVHLIDGSALSAEAFAITNGVAVIALKGEEVIKLPAANVSHVLFETIEEPLRSAWETYLESDSAADLLVLDRSDSLDYVEGLARAVSDTIVEFETDGETFRVRREKLAGLVFHPSASRDSGDAKVQVTDLFGSRLVVEDFSFDGTSLRIRTPSGAELERPLESIQTIDFSKGKLVFLSDLEWNERLSSWSPFVTAGEPLGVITEFYRPRRNRGFEAQELRLQGQSYAKGLALSSRTRLTYDLPDGFRRLTAVAGIATSSTHAGHVLLILEGDGQELFSCELRGGEPAIEVACSIEGVRRLSVLVDFGEDLSVGDCVNLCDARMVK